MSNAAMISIRIPTSLIEELKITAKKDHFLDVSESVRSIIRTNWIKSKDPLAFQLKKLKEEISENLATKNQADIIRELEKIRDNIQ